MENISNLEKLAVEVHTQLTQEYQTEFESLTWSCHCVPATEWYGDIFAAFSKIIKNNLIQDKTLK